MALRLRRGPPSIKTSAVRQALAPRLEAAPEATLEEPGAWYAQAAGVRVFGATMTRVIARHLRWTWNKRP